MGSPFDSCCSTNTWVLFDNQWMDSIGKGGCFGPKTVHGINRKIYTGAQKIFWLRAVGKGSRDKNISKSFLKKGERLMAKGKIKNGAWQTAEGSRLTAKKNGARCTV